MNIYLLGIGLPTIILGLISLIIYIIINPEIIDRWSYLLAKFSLWKGGKKERKIISKNLDYKISSVAKRINKESEGILPFGIRIKWKSPKEVSSYVQQDNVIVVLKKKDNSDNNIVEACMAYVPKALLPKSRNIIEKKLLNSIDHYVIKKILNEGNYDSAYNYFMQSILEHKLENDESFSTWFEEIAHIDSIGFFTRILLEEYRKLGNQLFGTSEETNYRYETVEFLKFLRQFYLREPGGKSRLIFLRAKIKIAIVFVASRKTLQEWGIAAHLRRIKSNIDLGVHRIFLFSYADSNFEKNMLDNHEYVQDSEKNKNFNALSQIEKACRHNENLRLLKKQKYHTKDVTGRIRSAKYFVYEAIR